MDLSGNSKFERATASLQPYKDMFTSVSDVLSWNDMVSPASSYPTSFTQWKENAEDVFDTLLQSGEITLNLNEDTAMSAAQQIGFGIMEKFLETAQPAGWSTQAPEARRAEVERILSLPQVPQRTQEWYAQGKSVLTASEFANLFGSPRALSQMAFQKVMSPQPQQTNRLACLTCEMGPFDWGIRFEPVVKQILEKRWGAKIVDSGRLIHPTDPLLAASPDGFLVDATDPSRVGRLLEIKCPISREVGVAIPFEYWCQMQIQMEVTGIEECEYVEVKIDSITKKTDLSGAEPDGYVWLMQNPKSCLMSYVYTEADSAAAIAEGLDLLEKIPWRLGTFYTKTVVRDKSWFQGTAEVRAAFWALVDQARKGEIQPFEVKSRTKITVTKEAECRIVDD